MKKYAYIASAIAILGLLFMFYPQVAAITKTVDPETQLTGVLEVIDVDLQHRRETWLSALEWCESRGYDKALNPQDLDGTPSFGAFQFKPSTFDHFRAKYELPESDLMDYDTQREIIRRMIDDPEVDFKQQFPNCVKKFVGLPPVK